MSEVSATNRNCFQLCSAFSATWTGLEQSRIRHTPVCKLRSCQRITGHRRPPDQKFMPEIIGLFPTPFMRVPGALAPGLVTGLVEHFSTVADRANNSSANLSHTAMLRPSDSPLLVEAAALITPTLAEFGALIFGERLGWSLKEMWV